MTETFLYDKKKCTEMWKVFLKVYLDAGHQTRPTHFSQQMTVFSIDLIFLNLSIMNFLYPMKGLFQNYSESEKNYPKPSIFAFKIRFTINLVF